MTPLILKAVNFFPELAADYKWFDVADIDHGVVYPHKENMDTIKNPMPFEKCAIAGIDLDGQTYAVLVSQEADGMLLIKGANTMAKYNNLQIQIDPVFRIDPMEEGTDDGITIHFEDKRYEGNDLVWELSTISIVVLAIFLRSLDRQLISEVYTPIPSKNHAKRLRQRKLPLFDWHTVTIEPPKPKAEAQGGTHASPRLHDVRGHWVKRGDKRYWRKAHQRGDASLGVVFHDYKLKGEADGKQTA
jgi:hypothetical protein